MIAPGCATTDEWAIEFGRAGPEKRVNKPQNILVIVDPTASEHPAVEKGAILAQKLDARLELYVCDTKAAREERLIAERAKDPSRLLTVNLKPMLEALAAPLRSRGLDVTTECEYAATLYAGLLSRMQRSCADLVVKDTHHHSLVKRTFITNTDWHLIRGCPVPLLLTRGSAWRDSPTLVAAVDPGHLNDKPALLDHHILEWGKCLATKLGGALHVVHAYVPLSIVITAAEGIAPMASALTPEALAFEDSEKRKQLSELTGSYGIDAGNIHLDLGAPSELLPRMAAQLQAEVLIMGAISRSGVQKVLVGSTAERVLERLPCDALVVKSPDFAATLPF